MPDCVSSTRSCLICLAVLDILQSPANIGSFSPFPNHYAFFLKDLVGAIMAPKGRKHSRQTLPPDLLSNLPKNALDGILVRLPLRDAVRTSILSKKWRYTWCRLPELTLDETLWETQNERLQLRTGKDLAFVTSNVTKIMYHILTLHARLITKFTLSIRFLVGCPNV